MPSWRHCWRNSCRGCCRDNGLPDLVERRGIYVGEMADWIDSVREPRSARLKGRLSYCVLKEDTKHDNGVILKDFIYTRMILLDVIEDSLPE